MKLTREWAMPSHETFSIKPIAKLISRYIMDGKGWADPFARNSILAEYTNDLDTSTNANSHLDALDFISSFEHWSLNGVLFDPPYSPRQVMECYNKIGREVTMEDTQVKSKIKDEIARKIRNGGLCISFGWNSSGLGKNRGFEIIEIMLIAHGGGHNDTICTVERKWQKKEGKQ